MQDNTNKKYLPSPQFIKKIVILVILIAIVIIITKVIPSFRAKLAQNKLEKTLLVKDLVIQDQNSNGIQDWEEALWGLDPSADGASNKEYILAKKKILNKDNVPESELTENDKMAREFFALVVSLQQSGNLNSTSMKSLANSIGEKIVAKDINDIYKDTMLQVTDSNTINIKTYYKALQKLNAKYKDKYIGDELVLIGQAIANNDKGALRVAILTAKDYHSFGTDLVAIPVPKALVVLHLELANNYEKTAQSLEGMSTMLDDPTGGMATLVKYKRYNDAIVKTIEKLTTFFKRNGIIK